MTQKDLSELEIVILRRMWLKMKVNSDYQPYVGERFQIFDPEVTKQVTLTGRDTLTRLMEVMDDHHLLVEEVRLRAIESRKPGQKYLCDSVPAELQFIGLYPDVMRTFDINTDPLK
jgi:hypothetical protein